MLPAELAECCSGKTAVEAMRRLWMFTAESRRRMWVEEETDGVVCTRADEARGVA